MLPLAHVVHVTKMNFRDWLSELSAILFSPEFRFCTCETCAFDADLVYRNHTRPFLILLRHEDEQDKLEISQQCRICDCCSA